MSKQLEGIANETLEALSAQVARLWATQVTNGFASRTSGNRPDPKTLVKIDRLTERYRTARAAYDEGNYLACIEIATAEATP